MYSLVPDGGALETGLINVGDEIVSIDGVEPSSSQHVMVCLCVCVCVCVFVCLFVCVRV
jgi:hypothetical protein